MISSRLTLMPLALVYLVPALALCDEVDSLLGPNARTMLLSQQLSAQIDQDLNKCNIYLRAPNSNLFILVLPRSNSPRSTYETTQLAKTSKDFQALANSIARDKLDAKIRLEANRQIAQLLSITPPGPLTEQAHLELQAGTPASGTPPTTTSAASTQSAAVAASSPSAAVAASAPSALHVDPDAPKWLFDHAMAILASALAKYVGPVAGASMAGVTAFIEDDGKLVDTNTELQQLYANQRQAEQEAAQQAAAKAKASPQTPTAARTGRAGGPVDMDHGSPTSGSSPGPSPAPAREGAPTGAPAGHDSPGPAASPGHDNGRGPVVEVHLADDD